MFNDTIPPLIILFALCVANGFILWNLLYYAKRFFIYVVICYFCYFLHIATLSWEYTLFDRDLPFYSTVSGYLIGCEFQIFLKMVDQYHNIRIPVISALLKKWQSMLLNNTQTKKHTK
jgi:hypothetical protein